MLKFIRKRFSISSNILSFAVVGSGPGGIYTAKHLLRKFDDIQIDFYERLPHPFGLVKTGVSPDHQEVKYVEKDFMSLMEDNRVRFLGNVSIGKDIPLNRLRENYSGIILAYGADSENRLNIQNEDSYGVFSARNFVSWYNGHILYSKNSEFNKFNFKEAENVTIIGNGNVAIDIARILSRDIDYLKTFDMPEQVINKLAENKIKNIHIVGRRGLMHAAFTIKELRELSKLDGVKLFVNKNELDESLESYTGEELNSILPSERRHITRKIDLVKTFNQIDDNYEINSSNKNIFFRFLMTPKEFTTDLNKQLTGITFTRNFLNKQNKLIKSQDFHIDSTLVFKSIGYKSLKIFEEIQFDEVKSVLGNSYGVVLDRNNNIVENIFCVGWVKTGPKGIIDSTLRDSYETAESIYKSISKGSLIFKTPNFEAILKELELNGIKTVTLEDWKKIDKYEIEEGKRKGKIREKVLDINEMFKIIGK